MISKQKLFKYLYENIPALYGNLGYRAVKVYQAKYGTRFVAKLIRAYGGNIFRSRWTSADGREHYGLPKALDLIRSHYHMQAIRKRQVKRINDYSFYTARKHQQDRSPYHIGFYSLLVSGAVDKVSRHGIWIDSINHRPVYKLLNSLHSKLAQQIRSNKRFRGVAFLAGSTENPYHLGGNAKLYSHGHGHGLISIASHIGVSGVVAELNRVVRKDFQQVFGYSLVAPERNGQDGLPHKLAPVQPVAYTVGTGSHRRTRHAVVSTKHGSSKADRKAMSAVDDFVEYMDTDYHLQTKDCSMGDFMKMSPARRHQLVCVQLNSTRGMSLNRGISQKTVDSAKASYDNYKHFVATDRWASHRKHLTSIEQWKLAQGVHSSKEPKTQQMNLITPRPAQIAVPVDLIEAGTGIHIYSIYVTELIAHTEYIPTETNDRIRHTGIPP